MVQRLEERNGVVLIPVSCRVGTAHLPPSFEGSRDRQTPGETRRWAVLAEAFAAPPELQRRTHSITNQEPPWSDGRNPRVNRYRLLEPRRIKSGSCTVNWLRGSTGSQPAERAPASAAVSTWEPNAMNGVPSPAIER